MPFGKVFFKREDQTLVEQYVTLKKVMNAVCDEYFQSDFYTDSLPNLIRLEKTGKAHVVRYLEVVHATHDGLKPTVEFRREE